MLWKSLRNKSWGHMTSCNRHEEVKLWSKKYLKKFAILPEVTLESRVRYQADVNFQDLSEIVKAAITLNGKALYYGRRIKINQKRLMNRWKFGNQTIYNTELTNQRTELVQITRDYACAWFRLMTYAHVYKTFISEDDVISFDNLIYRRITLNDR